VKTLLIVWCSTTGGTRQMAEAAEHGARKSVEAGDAVAVRRLHAAAAGAEDLLAADALVLATPEHLGSMAGPMKDFLDRVYYPCLDRVNGRPWALLVCAGSDGQGTIRQAERIATGLRLKRVTDPVLVITHAQTPEAILAPKAIGEADLARCAEAGALLAAGLACGIF
jgi:NAD(P)H-dependent FMN reductase